jgi:hypothetical protein
MSYEIHMALSILAQICPVSYTFGVLIQFQEADVARILDEQIAKRFSLFKVDGLEFVKLKAMERIESSLERKDNSNGYYIFLLV